MFKKFLLLCTLFASPAYAANYHLLSLDYFDMRYEQFADARDPYAPNYDNLWLYRVAADFNLSLGGVLYWNNYTHFETLKSQTPKSVGWQYEIGLRLTGFMDVYREHHSRHIFEEPSPYNRAGNSFPVEDVYGVRVKFVDDPSHKSSVSNLIFGK